MTELGTAPVARAYLQELRTALTGVPAEVRDGILSGVREELVGLTETDAAARIRELGDPRFIAAEAGAAVPPPPVPTPAPGRSLSSVRDATWFSVVAALLVMLGGVLIPVVGAVAGLALMWLSRAWTRTEKWIATLTPLAVIALSAVAAAALSNRPTPPATGPGDDATNPILTAGLDVVTLGILLLVVVQVAVGIWLLVRARRGPAVPAA